MAFDGNGNFVRSYSWVQDANNNIDITASRVDTEDNGFATGLSLCVTRDGQGKMTSDFLPNSSGAYNLGTAIRSWLNITALSGTIGPPSSGVAWSVNGVANSNAIAVISPNTAGQSFGMAIVAGTNASDYCARFLNAGSVDILRIFGDGGVTIGAPAGGSFGGGTINVQSDIILNGVQIYAGIPLNNQSSNYVLALGDASKCVAQANAAGTVTIPTNASVAFPIGTVISIYNDTSGNITIPTAGDTVRFGSTGASGTRTLAQNGLATILKLKTTTWVISGSGLS